MPQRLPTRDEDTIGSLVAEIVQDGQKLIAQELLLIRTELQHEWNKVKEASALFGAGIVIAGLGGLFLLMTLIHLLHAVTNLPLWACYGIFACVLSGGGAYLLLRGRARAKTVDFVPRQTVESVKQTVESVKENVTWFKNQT